MTWDDKKWRRKQYDLQEAEQQQQQQQAQGDQTLTQMVTSMTDYVMNMQTTLGTLPNYLPILMKPNDPAKSPEQNNIDRDTIIASMKSLDDNQKLLTKHIRILISILHQSINLIQVGWKANLENVQKR